MKYTRIDLAEWERGDLFTYYIENMRIVMSLTADIDVTELLAFTRARRLKFYPAMLWVVSRAVNAHDTFRYGWDSDGSLILWDQISPSYADFHREDGNFIKLATAYDEDFFTFYKRCMADRAAHRDRRGIAAHQPPNRFDVSCLPWVRYRHFDLHVFDEGRFLAPVVTWGRFEREGERYRMPLTMNIHHAVADGFHLSRFFLEVQELSASLETLLQGRSAERG